MPELTILFPCLNEEKTIEKCIDKAKKILKNNNIKGEILVADNGSTDDSLNLIRKSNVRLINVKKKGYGNTLIKGIKNSKGKYVIFCDSDDSYNIEDIPLFLKKLREGNDLVMGNRYAFIEKGAMKLSHYYGVKFLTYLGNVIYKTNLKDYHCGIRGINRKKIEELNLECIGMEFASELIIKCKLARLKIIEIPTKLFKDGRGHKSHLNTIKDGIRHIKCLVKYRKIGK